MVQGMNQGWDERFHKIAPYLSQVNSRVGKFAVYVNDSIVSYSIRLFGEYTQAEVEVISRYLNEGDTFIDVGTNIGYHARAVQQQTKCEVLAFEPNVSHFMVALHNCRDLPVQVVNAAVGAEVGTLKLTPFDPSQVGNYGELKIADEGDDVPVVALDGVGLQSCHLIKIDVEGFEINVLTGAANSIDKFRPVIQFEAQERDKWPACWKFLDDKNYSHYWIPCRNYPVGETFIPKPSFNPFGDGGVLNILAVPNERDQPIGLMPVEYDVSYGETVQRYAGDSRYILCF